MKRQIIQIDQDKCNGCGLCVSACHEGAIGLQNGKAVLLREDYCDGLGDCLPSCPTGAITFIEKDAPAYDAQAVEEHMKQKEQQKQSQQPLPCGCPGSHSEKIERAPRPAAVTAVQPAMESELTQWPVQIKLVPTNAPYFENANLLVAADCTAFAYGNFHQDFIRNHVVLIGCPKLDEGDYSEKLAEIIRNNNIKSVKVVRMEVPCCGGIERAVMQGLMDSGKMIPWSTVTITRDGRILEETA